MLAQLKSRQRPFVYAFMRLTEFLFALPESRMIQLSGLVGPGSMAVLHTAAAIVSEGRRGSEDGGRIAVNQPRGTQSPSKGARVVVGFTEVLLLLDL